MASTAELKPVEKPERKKTLQELEIERLMSLTTEQLSNEDLHASQHFDNRQMALNFSGAKMTTLHDTTFAYLQPTAEQAQTMSVLRAAALNYADAIDHLVPNGPDKTYILRKIRECAMWANVAVTRNADGSPRPVPGAPETPEVSTP